MKCVIWYSVARAASSGTQWSEELEPEQKDKNNNKKNYYEEPNRFV